MTRSVAPCYHQQSSNLTTLQEIAHYIAHIGESIVSILGDKTLVEFVDEDTIDLIRLRVPALSDSDHDFIRSNMKEKTLFPAIEDSQRRATILQHLLAIDFPFPSLYSLFRDIRYIEPAVELLKALVPAQDGTVRERLRFHFLCLGENTLEIQQGPNSYTTVTGQQRDLFEIALREMWLCALRSVSITVGNAPKRDMNPIKRTANAPNFIRWFKMVQLADRLGFSSPEISDVLQIDPAKKSVEEALCTLVPSETGKLSEDTIQKLAEVLRDGLANMEEVSHESSIPYVTVAGAGVPVLKRCGVSLNEHSDDADRNHLFLKKIHAPVSEYKKGGGGLSSFFVKRCRYLAFLGPVDLSSIFGLPVTDVPQATGTGDHFATDQIGPAGFFNAEVPQSVSESTAAGQSLTLPLESEDIAMSPV